MSLVAVLLLLLPATDAFAGIPGVTFVHYDVAGEDAEAIRRAIDAQRPTDAHDGTRVDAVTRWGMRWTRRGRRCTMRSVTITFSATVTLPRLVDPPPSVKPSWDRYIAALEMHEAAHARYAYDHRDDLRAAIVRVGCVKAEAAGRGAIAAIDAHETAYDRATRHGLTQGAFFP